MVERHLVWVGEAMGGGEWEGDWRLRIESQGIQEAK
jgi:hypothetical protein